MDCKLRFDLTFFFFAKLGGRVLVTIRPIRSMANQSSSIDNKTSRMCHLLCALIVLLPIVSALFYLACYFVH